MDDKRHRHKDKNHKKDSHDGYISNIEDSSVVDSAATHYGYQHQTKESKLLLTVEVIEVSFVDDLEIQEASDMNIFSLHLKTTMMNIFDSVLLSQWG